MEGGPAPRILRAGGVAAGVLMLCAGRGGAEEPDVDLVVRTAAQRQEAVESAAPRMLFDHAEVVSDLDVHGRPESVETYRYVAASEGKGIAARTLLSVNGRAPTERERRRVREEDEKRRRARASGERTDESEDADLRSGRLPLSDLLRRFDFRFLREERRDGRLAYLVEFGPKKGARPRTLRDRVLGRFGGRAWIDVAEGQVIRIEGRLLTPVKVAGGLALDIREVELVYEGRPVAPGVWAPCFEELRVGAKAALVLPFRKAFRYEFSGYRPADERLIASSRPGEALRSAIHARTTSAPPAP